jgi:hypothetical protein
MPRYHVVDGKLPALLATVLAGIAVTMKHAKAGQLPFQPGARHHIGQLDYRRYRENVSGGVDQAQPILEHFSLALKYQDYCPPCPAYIQCLIALV